MVNRGEEKCRYLQTTNKSRVLARAQHKELQHNVSMRQKAKAEMNTNAVKHETL